MKYFILITIFSIFIFENCTDQHMNISTTTEIIKNSQNFKVEVICKSIYPNPPRFTLKSGESREIQFNSEDLNHESLTNGGVDSVFIVFEDGKVKIDTNIYKKVRINSNEEKNITSDTYYIKKRISDTKVIWEYLIDSLDYQEAQ
jgi:hypothetical protein